MSEKIIDLSVFKDDLAKIDEQFRNSIISLFTVVIYKRSSNNEKSLHENEYIFITNDNLLFIYGKNLSKWLSYEFNETKPIQIELFDDKKVIHCDSGYNFIVLLTDDGDVYVASGNPKWNTKNKFRLINDNNQDSDDERFRMIKCGWHHLLLIRNDDKIFAIGSNAHYQLSDACQSSYNHDDGDDESCSYDKMIEIAGIKNVKKIECGFAHNIVLTNDNKLYGWGRNKDGQLFFRTDEPKFERRPKLLRLPDEYRGQTIKDVIAGDCFTMTLFKNGKCLYRGRNCINFQELKNIKAICGSKFFEFIIAYDGESYFAWGETKNGYLSAPRKFHSNDCDNSFIKLTKLLIQKPITFDLISINQDWNSSKDQQSNVMYNITNWLFDNPNNYDIEFIVENKTVKACEKYLCTISPYFNEKFANNSFDKEDDDFSLVVHDNTNDESNNSSLMNRLFNTLSITRILPFRSSSSSSTTANDNDNSKQTIKQIKVKKFSYEIFYSYLRMLHNIHNNMAVNIKGTNDNLNNDFMPIINQQNLNDYLLLARTYKDNLLMDNCREFIRQHLNDKTINKYIRLIIEYKLLSDDISSNNSDNNIQLMNKIKQITMEKILPNINNLKELMNKNNNNEFEQFLQWFYIDRPRK